MQAAAHASHRNSAAKPDIGLGSSPSGPAPMAEDRADPRRVTLPAERVVDRALRLAMNSFSGPKPAQAPVNFYNCAVSRHFSPARAC